jgi:hypothetical protein
MKLLPLRVAVLIGRKRENDTRAQFHPLSGLESDQIGPASSGADILNVLVVHAESLAGKAANESGAAMSNRRG